MNATARQQVSHVPCAGRRVIPGVRPADTPAACNPFLLRRTHAFSKIPARELSDRSLVSGQILTITNYLSLTIHTPQCSADPPRVPGLSERYRLPHRDQRPLPVTTVRLHNVPFLPP